MFPAPGFDVFQDILVELYRSEFTKRDLFGFFLFDDRPSQDSVGKFIAGNSAWLNSLANSCDMYLLAFIKPKYAKLLDDHMKRMYNAVSNKSNPSLEVARLFGIKPKDLPGIVLFTPRKDKTSLPDREATSDIKTILSTKREHYEDLMERKVDKLRLDIPGCYIPLRRELFDDSAKTENIISELFSALQDIKGRDKESFSKELQDIIVRFNKEQKSEEAKINMVGKAKKILSFPTAIIITLLQSAATEAGRKMLGS